MKVYKITLMVIDHDNIGADEVSAVLENVRYPNHCIDPSVAAVESRDIGEWDGDAPLNRSDTWKAEFEMLFSDGEGKVTP